MIDRNHVKAEMKMRIRFAAGGTTPVSGTLLENALELLEDGEKKLDEYMFFMKKMDAKLVELMGVENHGVFSTEIAKEYFKQEVEGMPESDFKDFCKENFDMITGD